MCDRFSVAVAVNTLRSGGIIAYPTEAVFGLGCDPDDTLALQSLIALKQRSVNAGLILIAASLEQASNYFEADEKTLEKLQATWPGPTTWILPERNVHPLVTGGRDTVAIRVSAHPVCTMLTQAFGRPIVSTSANLSGQRPATSVLQVRRKLRTFLDGIVNGPLGGQSQPTRIIDARNDHLIRA